MQTPVDNSLNIGRLACIEAGRVAVSASVGYLCGRLFEMNPVHGVLIFTVGTIAFRCLDLVVDKDNKHSGRSAIVKVIGVEIIKRSSVLPMVTNTWFFNLFWLSDTIIKEIFCFATTKLIDDSSTKPIDDSSDFPFVEDLD